MRPARESVDGLRFCTMCRAWLNPSRFGRRGDASDLLQSSCRECNNARQRGRKPPQPHEARAASLKYLYGLTERQWEEMWIQQGGTCAACRAPGSMRKSLCVDHDHKTGRVRGLLCDDCNTTLGKMRDNSGRLRRLASYLET